MKAVVAAFNQEKALVGAFSVLTNIRMELFQALISTNKDVSGVFWSEHGHEGVGPPPEHHGLPPPGLLQPHGLAALRGLAPVPATAAAHRAVTPAQKHQQILFSCDRYFNPEADV